MRLTQKTVDDALYEGRSYMSKGGRKRWTQHVLWDERLPGFGLRITPTNRKSFIVKYKAEGRRRTKTLGTATKLTLKQARQQAAELLESVDDTVDTAAAESSPAAGVETVAQLADAYLEHHLKGSVPSWYADQRLMRTHIKPALGRARVVEVAQGDLGSLTSRVGRRFPSDARRLRSLLKGMFDWADEHGLRGRAGPSARASKARSAARSPSESREATAKAEPAAEATPESAPTPERSRQELSEALRSSEKERRALADRLDELSSTGAEMLTTLNQQAAARKELETELARHRRQLQRAQAEIDGRPDAEAVERQTANLRQSVEQLLESLKQTKTERDQAAETLAAVERRAAAQARQLTKLTRGRDEAEDRLRDQERRAARPRPSPSGAFDRRRVAAWVALGAAAGVLLTLLVQLVAGAAGARTGVEASPRGAPARPADPPRSPQSAAAEPTTGDPSAPGAAATSAAPPAEPPAPAAAEPTAEPATPPSLAAVEGPVETDAEAAVEAAIRGWAAAWSEQRVDDYLAAYSTRFQPPDGLSRDAWKAQRRRRITRPASIRVTLDDLRFDAAGPARMSVSFAQAYETPTYSDGVRKTLELARESDGWKIVAERSGGAGG